MVSSSQALSFLPHRQDTVPWLWMRTGSGTQILHTLDMCKNKNDFQMFIGGGSANENFGSRADYFFNKITGEAQPLELFPEDADVDYAACGLATRCALTVEAAKSVGVVAFCNLQARRRHRHSDHDGVQHLAV